MNLFTKFTISLFLMPAVLMGQQKDQLHFKTYDNVKPRNIIFILSDDHRYDFMGFTGKVPGLKTPHLDRLAKEGAHLKNAFVTTSLCSPSRASILTGQYAHTHTVVDNQSPQPEYLIFFPQYLQQVGYQTGFFGKWHMGGDNPDPRPGFDKWVSFQGQGVYYNPTLNIDGKTVKYSGGAYITDVLTGLSIDWLKSLKKDKPFFLYLSHKAVHSEFNAAKRHRGLYKDIKIQYPVSMFMTKTDSSKNFTKGQWVGNEEGFTFNKADVPQWVKAQRYSWHGVDYMYHGQTDFDQFYQDYLETLMGVDESVGAVLDFLQENDLDKETLVVYMGDNGFAFGEHGLIDKRTAFEESMRVPLLARCPAIIKPATVIEQDVLNIDIAPTFLELAGIRQPQQMQGASFVKLLQGRDTKWREEFFYEYYWENAFPQTPSQFAVRTDRYKFIRSQGIWDIDQLYDLVKDPYEVNNLIRKPEYQELGKELNIKLWKWLGATNGLYIPLKPVLKPKKDHLYKNTW
ncbi:sulfatase [Niabella insulamsoli]|uniref:sulfatase family protein n=1 Tax=Niabella insulamsoli TaxID=3144874 RepID=UPI0031FDBA28